MRMTATELRANLYRVLDRVLESGEEVEIERHGRKVRLVRAPTGPQQALLDRLEPHPGYLACDAESLVHLDWSGEWKP